MDMKTDAMIDDSVGIKNIKHFYTAGIWRLKVSQGKI